MPKFIGTLGPAGRPGVVSEGDEVANLQELLTHLGYEVPITGVYDLKTTRAMQNFQQDNELPVNGMLGLQARKLLNERVTGEES